MSKELVVKKTFDHFQSGYCCSESICKAIAEAFSDQSIDISKTASAFCGGVGGTKEELCGTFTGGLISIGWLFGRSAPGQDNQVTKELAVKYREEFLKQFGSVNCGELLCKFGDQEDSIKCKEMTAKAAGLLFDLIQPIIKKGGE